MSMMGRPNNVNDYIASYPPEVQEVLEKMRRTIQEEAPEAVEAISYGMPTYKLNGNLVHFAAYKNHIGFYPTPSAITAFQKDLTGYKQSKGAVQFPLDKPIPYELVRKLVRYRVKESMGAAKTRKK